MTQAERASRRRGGAGPGKHRRTNSTKAAKRKSGVAGPGASSAVAKPLHRQPWRTDQARAVRELYVGLLVNALTGMVQGDPAIDPANKGRFDPKVRQIGRDWPSHAVSMAGVDRLASLSQLVQACLDEKIPGHFIETGVWRGGACILMRGILAANGAKRRKVFVADSFQGLPPPEMAQDAGDRHHTVRELAVGREEVQANFRKFNLLDGQVVFVEGWFKDTLPKLKPKRFALIRLDGDMYASTFVALENLYPKLSPGGYCVIDDYALVGCRRAVTDYRAAHGITEPIEHIDWIGVWWRKAGETTRERRSQAGSKS